MGRALLEAANPPMWWIDSGMDGKSARFVRFGEHQIAIADIVSMSLEEVREPQASGLFLKGVAFLCGGAALAYSVYESGARERFLIGAVFLTGLGIAAVTEASRLRSLRFYELSFLLRDNRRVVFTSADRTDVQALALRLAAEGAAHV